MSAEAEVASITGTVGKVMADDETITIVNDPNVTGVGNGVVLRL